MFSRFRSRSSAITFDVGTAGIRAFQLEERGARLSSRDSLRLDLLPTQGQAGEELPPPDYSRLARLVGQGSFAGSDVGLVLSPPDVRFCALRLPKKALAQPEKRICEALAWEVAREMRADAHELELRYWPLPPGHQQGLNVMAVALPIQRALSWYQCLARDHLRLRRLNVSPCALVHLACRLSTPPKNELWGVLDLGFRRATLTVVLGNVPTYIRLLPASSDAWTRRLAEAFEVTYATAEQIKRTHGIRPVGRGIRPPQAGQSLLNAEDIPSVVFGLLREPLDDLVHEINKCFAYVMQNFPDVNPNRLLLAGGGAKLRGLAPWLQLQLGLSAAPLTNADGHDTANPPTQTRPSRWQRPLAHTTIHPDTAAAVGGAILDLDSQPAGGDARPTSVNLLPESCHNARRRVVRRNTWTAVALCAALLVLGTWMALHATNRAMLQLDRDFATAQGKQAELGRQLALATNVRNGLAQRARALSILRQDQRLPQQLLTLAQQAPDGVVFTEILAEPAGRPRLLTRPPARALSPAAGEPQKDRAHDKPAPLVVRMAGYAVNHDELTRLIDALQHIPRWERVELLRAARKPYRTGVALAFRLECWPAEASR